MRYCEIAALYTIPYCYPHVVMLAIHPSLWDRLERWVDARCAEFRLLYKREVECDSWIVDVGCSTEAARYRFDGAWGQTSPTTMDAVVQGGAVSKRPQGY